MNNYCKRCGAKLDPEQKHICPKAATCKKIKNYILSFINYDDSSESEIDYYERGKAIIPDSIAANEGEVTVKQYDLAVLRTRHKLTRAEGKMQITNKRVVFRSTGRSPGGKTTYQSEFAMDKIDGVEIRRDYRFLFWDFFINMWLLGIFHPIGRLIGMLFVKEDGPFLEFLALMLAAASAIPFFLLKKKYLTKILSLSVGVGIMLPSMVTCFAYSQKFLLVLFALVLLILAILYLVSLFMSFFKPNLVIEIKTSGGTPGVQIKHRFSSLLIWKRMDENSGFSEILPGKDADLAIKEIGAIINDIKTLGDFGIEKWKK